MTDEQKRFNKGLVFALCLHIVAAGILGILGFRFEQRPPQVLEVTLTGGGPAAATNDEIIEEKIEQISKEDIVDKKLKQKKEQRKVEKKVMTNPNVKPNPNAKHVAEGGTGTGDSHVDGGGKGEGSGKGVPVTPPRIVSSVKPVYPVSARNASIEGTVYVKMLVNVSGKVEEAFIVQSSGNTALDDSAIKAVYKWRFSPARDTFKEKVACYITVPVNFKLNR